MKIKIHIIVLFLFAAAIRAHAEEFPLSIATNEYPHMEAIRTGAVKIPECRISYSTATLKELQQKFETGSAGDVIEVDFVSYLKHYSNEPEIDWVLVPVYLCREFPHHYIQQQKPLPNQTLSIWAQAIVSTLTVVSDSIAAEKEYFKETRIFPIVTVLAVRKELVKANPWLPEAIFIAFSEAKAHALEAGTIPLPWGPEHREETISLMNKNYWSYGVRNNPKTLSALFQYAHEQGVISHELKPDDVFAPETLQLIDEKGAKN